MSNMVALTLKNNADVNVTYGTQKASGGEYAKWNDRTNGTLAAQSTVALAVKEAKLTRSVVCTTVFPVLVVATGLYVNSYARTEYTIPYVHAAIDRLDLRKRHAAFIGTTEVLAAIDNGEGVF